MIWVLIILFGGGYQGGNAINAQREFSSAKSCADAAAIIKKANVSYIDAVCIASDGGSK